MATADEQGQIGRNIYTYLHLPIIAGIVLVAVSDELVVAVRRRPACGWCARRSRRPGALPRRPDGVFRQARETQSRPRIVALVVLLPAVPFAASADGLVVSTSSPRS